jgi:hypothetical protein
MDNVLFIHDMGSQPFKRQTLHIFFSSLVLHNTVVTIESMYAWQSIASSHTNIRPSTMLPQSEPTRLMSRFTTYSRASHQIFWQEKRTNNLIRLIRIKNSTGSNRCFFVCTTSRRCGRRTPAGIDLVAVAVHPCMHAVAVPPVAHVVVVAVPLRRTPRRRFGHGRPPWPYSRASIGRESSPAPLLEKSLPAAHLIWLHVAHIPCARASGLCGRISWEGAERTTGERAAGRLGIMDRKCPPSAEDRIEPEFAFFLF